MHILRCMHLMEAISESELLSFTGSGSLDCDALAITCTREDFIVISLMMGESQTLFKTLEGLQSCGPLCMGIWITESGSSVLDACLEDEECDRWVPRLECGHIYIYISR